ncbi:MAG: 2-aminoadipate transaminase [Burkholderia gladioli]|nr:MAG: 2-aminoadipate transaminase [Burkholderia gladioli]
MPYTPDGPDLDALETLVQQWRPKMLVINSVLQNPTGTSLSVAQAFRILRLAEAYDFLVVEDDIYGDLCPARYPATRLASLDQLKRVIYLGSFSKTLAANLRVGYVAGSPEIANALTDQKMLAGMATPELNERVLYKVLTEGRGITGAMWSGCAGGSTACATRPRGCWSASACGCSRCRRRACSCGPTPAPTPARCPRPRTRRASC